MIKKAQMMLQASIGRTAENAEIEQLEATIESAKNLGLPSEGLFILTVQILVPLTRLLSHAVVGRLMSFITLYQLHITLIYALLDRSDYGTSPQPY